jgi:hypothetical protein
MGIYHGSLYGIMTEEFLDYFQIDAFLNQPGSIGITQVMESEILQTQLISVNPELPGDLSAKPGAGHHISLYSFSGYQKLIK